MMGVITPPCVADLSARVSRRGDRPVHEPHRPRRDRQQAREGDRNHPGARREASEGREVDRLHVRDSVFQIAAHEETIPLEELYEGCRVAREILTGQARRRAGDRAPFTGEPGNYERTPNRHDFSLEPKRPNYLSLIRDAGHKVYGVGKISRHLRRLRHRRVVPDESNVRASSRTVQLLQDLDVGLRLREPRGDRHALGPSQRPGELPPLPAGLPPPAA